MQTNLTIGTLIFLLVVVLMTTAHARLLNNTEEGNGLAPKSVSKRGRSSSPPPPPPRPPSPKDLPTDQVIQSGCEAQCSRKDKNIRTICVQDCVAQEKYRGAEQLKQSGFPDNSTYVAWFPHSDHIN